MPLNNVANEVSNRLMDWGTQFLTIRDVSFGCKLYDFFDVW